MSLFLFQDISSDTGIAKTEQPNQPIITVLNYVEKMLPRFIEDIKSAPINNENGLTQKLNRILLVNLNDEYPFSFDKEGMEDETKGNSPAIDIDVITKESISVNTKFIKRGNRFFAFEAKLLGSTASHREREYVIGHDTSDGKHVTCGGLERFKKSIHGNGLNQCGMIGYMITKDFDKWHSQINSWIEELILINTDSLISWSIQDKLNLKSINHQKAHYISNNSRMKSGKEIDPIMIYHIWINLQ